MVTTRKAQPPLPFLDWLLALAPGKTRNLRDRVDVFHNTGKQSTLWKRMPGTKSNPSLDLLPLYQQFEAAVLFDSTFKVCSLGGVKRRHAVPVVGTVAQRASDVKAAGISFPKGATPFMSGIQSEYALDETSRKIVEYDLELEKISARHPSVEKVIEEWFEAVHSNR
jgi:hypothetical protein